MKSSPKDEKLNSRRLLLADAAKSLGKLWAEGWFEELRSQGRPITGGWPGTMSEARGRVRAHAGALLTKRSMSPLTDAELADAARMTYDSATAKWFGSRVRDEGVA